MRLKIDWLLVVIMMMAVGLRWWQFGAVPKGTYWDETAILVDAMALAQSGKDMHGLPAWQLIFPSYGDYKMPVLIWLAAFSVKILGASSLALRLPSLLAGIGTVWLGYALGKKLWPKNLLIARFSALAVAVAPWDIMFSHTAFEGHVAQFFLGLSAWCLLHLTKRPLSAIAAAVWGMVATYTYFSVRFVWPVVWVGLAPWLLTAQKPQPQRWGAWLKSVGFWPWLLAGVGFVGLLWPMTQASLYQVSNQFRLNADSVLKMQDWPVVSNQYREWAGNHLWDRVFYHRHWLMAQELLRNYADHLDLNYLFFTGDPNLRHGTGQYGLFLYWFLGPFLVGWIWIWWHQKPIAIWLTAWWLAALLPASVPENTPHALRSLNALLPLSLVIGIGSAALWQWLTATLQPRWLRQIGVGILGIGLVWQVMEFTWYYTTQYPQTAYTAWQTDFDQTFQHLTDTKATVQLAEHSDDKFFLWALLNINFQQPPLVVEEKYQFTQVGAVKFGKITAAQLQNQAGVATLTTPKRLQELTTQLAKTPISTKTTTDASGDYVVAVWP